MRKKTINEYTAVPILENLLTDIKNTCAELDGLGNLAADIEDYNIDSELDTLDEFNEDIQNIKDQVIGLILNTPTVIDTRDRSRSRHREDEAAYPKISIPTFNGEVSKWTEFWNQYSETVHDVASLSDRRKIVYLQQALKDGKAAIMIEAMNKSGDQYEDAIEILKERFDRPREVISEHIQQYRI